MCLVGVLATAGCGLIDSDVTDLDLRLPEKEVKVDTADWQLSDQSSLPAVDCSANESICGTAMAEVCASDQCSGACGGGSCEVMISVSLWNKFDLRSEEPEVQQIEGQPLVSVSVKRVYYDVAENTLNVPTPPLSLYVAPESVMDPSDPQADKIGTIASVPPMTTVDDNDVQLTERGKDRLAARMKEYSTPFNLIVATDLQLQAGDPMPTGRLRTIVKATATASTGL